MEHKDHDTNIEDTNASNEEKSLSGTKGVKEDLADAIADTKTDEEEALEALSSFADRLIASQKDMDPDMQKLVNENFFDLL